MCDACVLSVYCVQFCTKDARSQWYFTFESFLIKDDCVVFWRLRQTEKLTSETEGVVGVGGAQMEKVEENMQADREGGQGEKGSGRTVLFNFNEQKEVQIFIITAIRNRASPNVRGFRTGRH